MFNQFIYSNWLHWYCQTIDSADINHQGQNGDTALMWGFKKISKNNTLNLSSLNFNFFTKSYIACGLGYTDVVNLLIQAGADVNL